MQTKRTSIKLLIVFTNLVILSCISSASAQNKNQMVRLAKLVIDSAQLENYKALLKEEIETSVRVEPGVITLYAVSERIIQRTSLSWKYMQIQVHIKRICKHLIYKI